MINYIAPILNKHGNSTGVVKGSCGFGVENWSFDQTGASVSNWRTRVLTGIYNIGFQQIRTYRCEVRNRCGTSHEC